MKRSDPETKSPESIESLKKRYLELSTLKAKAEANVESSARRLDELKKEAFAKFGTDDVDALQKRLAETVAENEKKRHDYQQHLAKIQAGLDAVEASFSAVGSEGKQ